MAYEKIETPTFDALDETLKKKVTFHAKLDLIHQGGKLNTSTGHIQEVENPMALAKLKEDIARDAELVKIIEETPLADLAMRYHRAGGGKGDAIKR